MTEDQRLRRLHDRIELALDTPLTRTDDPVADLEIAISDLLAVLDADEQDEQDEETMAEESGALTEERDSLAERVVELENELERLREQAGVPIMRRAIL